MAKATFAAGCFWGVEAAFRRVKGVKDAAVGYTGGHKPNPTYQEVCYTATGHAEAVEVEFDPQVVSYERLLEMFWEEHDPCARSYSRQYKAAVYWQGEAQKEAALRSRDERGRKSGISTKGSRSASAKCCTWRLRA